MCVPAFVIQSKCFVRMNWPWSVRCKMIMWMQNYCHALNIIHCNCFWRYLGVWLSGLHGMSCTGIWGAEVCKERFKSERTPCTPWLFNVCLIKFLHLCNCPSSPLSLAWHQHDVPSMVSSVWCLVHVLECGGQRGKVISVGTPSCTVVQTRSHQICQQVPAHHG
jgi:hypothetical protein